MLNLILNL